MTAMSKLGDAALRQFRKPWVRALILIADVAALFVGVACVFLTAVFPWFAEVDADQWARVRANASLAWQVWRAGLVAVFVLSILASLCDRKFRPWAAGLFVFWILLIVPMYIGAFFMVPQDMRMRHLIAAKEKSVLKHNELAALCLALRRQGFRSEVPKSSWPAPIAALNPNYVVIGEDGLTVELCGGFDHFGYKLEKSADGKNWVWQWSTETELEDLAKLPVDPKLDGKVGRLRVERTEAKPWFALSALGSAWLVQEST